MDAEGIKEWAAEVSERGVSEWTLVSKKAKGKKRSIPSCLPPVAGPPDNFRPNPAPELSSKDIKEQYEFHTTRWRSSDGYKKLYELVKARASSYAPIKRAVCLGLGVFDPQDGSYASKRRSHIQLASFLTIVEILEKNNNQKIECFYQEPRFAQPDKDFLQSLGGEVIDHPRAYDLIDETTLVFGIHLYRDLWKDCLRKSLPGMFVGTGAEVWEEVAPRSLHEFASIYEMHITYDQLPFPQDEFTSFTCTCIYWKKRPCDNDTTADAKATEGPNPDVSNSTKAVVEEPTGVAP